MKILFKKAACFMLSLLVLVSTLSISNVVNANNVIPRVFILGDSTAARYSDNERPMTGWGEMIYNFFDNKIVIDDRAVSGATSKSFYEKHWSGVKNTIVKGDYVLIQFCHNDQKYGITGQSDVVIEGFDEMSTEEKFEAQTAITKEYVEKFIAEVKEKEATPIIITSIERRNRVYGNEGIDMTPWINLYKSIANEKEVTCLDLNPKTWELYQSYGEEGSKKLFVIVQPGEFAGYPEGKNDNTHLREKGAFEVAKLIAQLIKASDSNLKDYLVANFPEEPGLSSIVFEEDFERGTVNSIIADSSTPGYNNWYIANKDANNYEVNTDAKISYEIGTTNKTGNLIYKELTNTSGKQPSNYNMTKAVTEDVGRYVSWKYRVRSDDEKSGMLITRLSDGTNNFTATIDFNGGRVFVNGTKASGDDTSYITLEDNKWYDVELYFDFTEKDVKIYINNTKIYDTATLDNRALKITGIASVIFAPNRTAGGYPTADFKFDDIKIENISVDEYNDSIGMLPDTTYIFNETFKRGNVGESIPTSGNEWNEWIVSGYSYKVVDMKFDNDPKDSSNTVLSLQRTGIPSGSHNIKKSFTAVNSGYYSLKFSALSHNQNDRYLEIVPADSEGNTWKMHIYFNSGEIRVYKTNNAGASTYVTESLDDTTGTENKYSVTRDKWYNFDIIYNLNGDVGVLTAYVNGRKIFDEVQAPNDAAQRTNKGSLSSVLFQLNREQGSVLGDTSKVDEYTTDENTLIADVKLDNISLKSVETEPISVVYSNDGTKISGVKINNERVAENGEKMLVAVYETVDEANVLKGVSMCEDIVYGKNSLNLETPIAVENGDTVKVFFWNMTNLLPKALLETVK